MPIRRRNGATLGLVGACALVLVILAVATFFLLKIFGGFRELSNATDAGILNVAKQAMNNPSYNLADQSVFPNVDVRNNFALLGETPNSTVCLKNYNRLVVQSVMVAFNARDEGTPESARNARKVWQALNDVGKKLTQGLTDESRMENPFVDIATKNNTKMLGGNPISAQNFGVSYLRRGGSTNIYVSPQVAAMLKPNGLPLNESGLKKPPDMPYVSGYSEIKVPLRASGETLSFTGVPVGPQGHAHLVSLDDFTRENNDNFIVGAGSPGYPSDTLPPNSFKFSGLTSESRTKGAANTVACAIVGSVTNDYPMQLENAYIVIKNGPSAPGLEGKSLANAKNDIFAEELAVGVVTQGSSPGHLFTDNFELWDAWANYNTGNGSMPNLAASQQDIRKGDRTIATLDELKTITKPVPPITNWTVTSGPGAWRCKWTVYDDGNAYPLTQVCVDSLDNFKAGFNKYGSTNNGTVADSGFTNLEQFKADILTTRADPTLKTCAKVEMRKNPSGLKWYDQTQFTASPRNYPVNFGGVRSPYDYLTMIAKYCVFPSAKDPVYGPVMAELLKRCQQIVPETTMVDLERLLQSQPLPMSARLYICRSGNKLAMKTTPPVSAVQGTTADGTAFIPVGPFGVGKVACFNGQIFGRLANSYFAGPGGFPMQGAGDGDFGQPYGKWPQAQVSDTVTWTPSSGYNNLLGELEFLQMCEGGGKFCKPN